MLKKLVLPSVLAASLSIGCMAPTDVGSEGSELRTSDIEVTLIDYDAVRGEFTVGIELDAAVLEDSDATYLVAQLFYSPPRGAGVSPFSATLVDDVEFTSIGRTRLAAELLVAGPRPSDIDDVVARVSANPTPHP